MRKCKDCQGEKEDGEFFHNYLYKGKLKPRPRCSVCNKNFTALLHQKRKDADPEKFKEKRIESAKKYSQKNKEKMKAYWKCYRQKHKEKQREYARKWSKKNKDKCTAYTMKYRHKSPENMEKHNAVAKKYQRRVREEQRGQHLVLKMRRHFRRICNGVKAKKSFQYIGVESVEDFVSKMSAKTDNPNWLKDGYQIDHFWQINWVRDYCNKSPENAESLYSLIHHHSNVRPLERSVNSKRSFYDFSPLNKEDFNKFEPFLNENVKRALLKFWDNAHLFSGAQINKCSDEERIILGWLKEQD